MNAPAAAEFSEAFRRWRLELDLAREHFRKWDERADKIVKRYRDEREISGGERFNILWSNVQTIRPAVYAKTPKPEVSRRYNDHDPVGRAASIILERCLEYEVEHYSDFTSAMRNCLDDRLLPGRGVCWLRYDPKIETQPGEPDDDTQTTEDAEQGAYEQIKYECAPTDYVAWKDFRHQPARTWEEVNWVARRVYMYRDELHKRFDAVLGEAEVEKVPCDHEPKGLDKSDYAKESAPLKQAEIWEIWDKRKSQVCWIAEGFDRALDIKPDPLKLDEFFPCPKPLYATLTTDSLIPVPDFCMYQDQADELDRITERINLLTKAVRAAGVYDSSAEGVKRLLSETASNELIPVKSWAMFAEKGGLKGAVDWLPLDQIVVALDQLYTARESVKQTIYEITGLADIVRGASEASETATAQQIKSRFASLRIQELQHDMARFASDVLRMKAQVICTHFQPETILQMSGFDQTLDGQDPMATEQAIMLLKSAPIRSFRIEVNSDSMIDLDVEQEKQARVEFLTATGGFLNSALPVAQAAPPLLPLIGEMLRFGVRGFKAGREIEAAFDTAMQAAQAAPMIPPEVQQMQAQLQEREAALAEQEQGLMQTQEQVKGEAAKLTEDKMALDFARKEFGLQQQAAKDQEAMKAQVEKFQTQQQKEVETFKQKGLEQVGGAISEHMGTLQQFAQQVGDALQRMAETVAQVREEQAAEIQAVAEAVQQTQATMVQFAKAKRTPVRGADGRVSGVSIEGFTDTVQ